MRTSLLSLLALLLGSCAAELAPPPEADPVVFEVVAERFYRPEVDVAVAAMRRQVRSAGGIAGRPVEFRVTSPTSLADVVPTIQAVSDRVRAEPPAGLVGPVTDPFFASLFLDAIEATNTPTIYPYPVLPLVFETLPSTNSLYTLSAPPPSFEALRDQASCTELALVSTPNGVSMLWEPILNALFEPGVPVTPFPSSAASLELVGDVAEANPDCIFLALIPPDSREFMRLWGEELAAGRVPADVQFLGSQSLQVGAYEPEDTSFVDGALIITPSFADPRRTEAREFIDYVATIDDSLTPGQVSIAAGVYDALALQVLAAEFRLVADPSVSPAASVQIVSTPSADGFDQASPGKIADGLERVRDRFVNYQGAIGSVDLSPVDKYPNSPWYLLRFEGGQFNLVQEIATE